MKTPALLFVAILFTVPLQAQQATPDVAVTKPTALCTPAIAPEGRPANWAQPIKLAGVKNLHRISDNLYRSGQPTAEGFRNLEKECGIKTVINFRQTAKDNKDAAGTSLKLKLVDMFTGDTDDEHVVKTMRILKQEGEGPFLIHCRHGSDRTGLMSAMYRVLFQNWSAQDAWTELNDGGYDHSSFWWPGIKKYVLKADPAKLRALIDAP